MTSTTASESDRTAPTSDTATTGRHDRLPALRLRHARRLAELMAERDDLRGVHALADFVDDSMRWSA